MNSKGPIKSALMGFQFVKHREFFKNRRILRKTVIFYELCIFKLLKLEICIYGKRRGSDFLILHKIIFKMSTHIAMFG